MDRGDVDRDGPAADEQDVRHLAGDGADALVWAVTHLMLGEEAGAARIRGL